MEITLDTQPQPETPDSPPMHGGARPVGWWRAIVLLIFLGSFGSAFMRMGDRHRSGLDASPDLEELRALQALWETKPQHQRPWQPATSGWYQAWAPHQTWHGVPPLWPWLMSFGGPLRGETSAGPTLMELQEAGLPLPAWVEEMRGSVWHTNQWLSLGFLAILALGVGRKWSLLGAVNLTLVLGWAVLWPLQFRATPEALSMVLFLLTSLGAVRLLLRNTVWPHVHFGLLAGLAYLTDLSIIPLLAAWLLVTTARFLRGILDKSPEGSWTCRGHFIGLLALVFAFLAVTAPNLLFHHHQDGKALHPALNRYENGMTQSALELRSRTMESLQTMVKSGSEASLPAAVQPSRILILGSLMGLLLIAVAYAAGGGSASFRKGAVLHAESRSIFYLIMLTAILYAATANPGAVLWQVFGLWVLVLTMGAESLYGWAGRRSVGGVYRAIFTGLQLVLTVHLMICMFQFFRELPTHS